MAPEFVILARNGSATTESPPKSVENAERLASLSSISKDDLGAWIERLRDAGIVVDRHNSPDLIGQLKDAKNRPVDTVLCSFLDSDPTVALNASVAQQFGYEVIAGATLVARIVGSSRIVLCADQRITSNAWNDIRKLIRGSSARLAPIVNDYPQADPTLLLYSLLGRRLQPGELPTERNAVILDAAAALAIGRRFLADEAMTHAPLAVRDHAQKLSHFVFAPVGMKVTDLLAALGHPTGALIRAGDLLRDQILSPDATLGQGELVIHTSDPEPDINPDTCIRCGWCIEACPTRVQPAVVLEAAQRDDMDLAEQAGIAACIECGICSYVCPSKLPLLEGIRGMKQKHEI